MNKGAVTAPEPRAGEVMGRGVLGPSVEARSVKGNLPSRGDEGGERKAQRSPHMARIHVQM